MSTRACVSTCSVRVFVCMGVFVRVSAFVRGQLLFACNREIDKGSPLIREIEESMFCFKRFELSTRGGTTSQVFLKQTFFCLQIKSQVFICFICSC